MQTFLNIISTYIFFFVLSIPFYFRFLFSLFHMKRLSFRRAHHVSFHIIDYY